MENTILFATRRTTAGVDRQSARRRLAPEFGTACGVFSLFAADTDTLVAREHPCQLPRT